MQTIMPCLDISPLIMAARKYFHTPLRISLAIHNVDNVGTLENTAGFRAGQRGDEPRPNRPSRWRGRARTCSHRSAPDRRFGEQKVYSIHLHWKLYSYPVIELLATTRLALRPISVPGSWMSEGFAQAKSSAGGGVRPGDRERSIYRSIDRSIELSIYLSTYLSLSLSIYIYIYIYCQL